MAFRKWGSEQSKKLGVWRTYFNAQILGRPGGCGFGCSFCFGFGCRLLPDLSVLLETPESLPIYTDIG